MQNQQKIFERNIPKNAKTRKKLKASFVAP